METKISVLLADPGEQYRAAYSKAIGQETDMELVAQTDNGLRAEELITKFQPDVVVLDLVLPNLDGLSLLTHLFVTVKKCIVARARHLRDLQRSGADGVCGARHDVLYAKAV